MKKTTAAATNPKPIAADTLRVAYHAGPPEIGYFGSTWRRGEPQAVTAQAWEAMQKRADFAPLEFRIEPAAPAEQE